MPTFIELVKQVNPDFDDTKYPIDDGDIRFDELIEEFILKLPGCQEVVGYDDYRGMVYMGRECEVDGKHLYQFGEHYLVFSFEGCGDDMEVANVKEQYSTPEKFYSECFEVYTETEFKYEEFLDEITDLGFIMKFYRKIGLKDPKKEFLKYIESRYTESDKEIVVVEDSDSD